VGERAVESSKRRLRGRLCCTNSDGEYLSRAQSNGTAGKPGSRPEGQANGSAQPRSYNEAPRRCLWCDDEQRRELTPGWPRAKQQTPEPLSMVITHCLRLSGG
jgi:hypothetical protein